VVSGQTKPDLADVVGPDVVVDDPATTVSFAVVEATSTDSADPSF
jgi:hypothetical protein